MKTTLSAREAEVTSFVILGWENKEIAAKLGISARTVEDHRTATYRKRGVRNAVELTRVEYGLDAMPVELAELRRGLE